ncbi:hypothetical protein ACWKSP_24870 [Micromonosporaceae bacterium Da 78-11]
MDQLHQLAEHHRHGDPAALNDITNAIILMTAVRAALISNADHLSTL